MNIDDIAIDELLMYIPMVMNFDDVIDRVAIFIFNLVLYFVLTVTLINVLPLNIFQSLNLRILILQACEYSSMEYSYIA